VEGEATRLNTQQQQQQQQSGAAIPKSNGG